MSTPTATRTRTAHRRLRSPLAAAPDCSVPAGPPAPAMGGAAGHAGLASALGGAAEQGTKAFLDLGSAYRHVASGLTTTASTYAQTEHDLVKRSEDIARGPL